MQELRARLAALQTDGEALSLMSPVAARHAVTTTPPLAPAQLRRVRDALAEQAELISITLRKLQLLEDVVEQQEAEV